MRARANKQTKHRSIEEAHESRRPAKVGISKAEPVDQNLRQVLLRWRGPLMTVTAWPCQDLYRKLSSLLTASVGNSVMRERCSQIDLHFLLSLHTKRGRVVREGAWVRAQIKYDMLTCICSATEVIAPLTGRQADFIYALPCPLCPGLG